MDTTANTIAEFERLLTQVSPNQRQHAYYFANKSLKSAIFYMRVCIAASGRLRYSIFNDHRYKPI